MKYNNLSVISLKNEYGHFDGHNVRVHFYMYLYVLYSECYTKERVDILVYGVTCKRNISFIPRAEDVLFLSKSQDGAILHIM